MNGSAGLVDAGLAGDAAREGLGLTLPLTVLLSVLAAVLYKTDKKPRYENSPPGPRGLPVIGNLHQLGGAPQKTLTQWRAIYGDVYSIQMGSWPTVVINGKEAVKQAVMRQAEDFAGRPAFYTFNYIAEGKSMGFSTWGARWKLHRRIAQNALATFINSREAPIARHIQAEALFLARTMISGSGSGSGAHAYDPRQEIYLSVGNIICVTCFGKCYRRDDPEFVALTRMNDEFMAYAGAGNPVDVLPWIRHFTKKSFNRFVTILGHMTEFCNRKREEHLATYSGGEVRDVTDALIRCTAEIGEEEKEAVGLTDDHILTTVEEMIAAGFDTIATTLHWAVLFMATHPDVQARAQREITDVIGDRNISADDVTELPYVEACILEILRHSCIFPLALPHSTTRDTSLLGYEIPKDTLVFLNMWSLNHDPARFPDPHLFNPARFLDDEGLKVNKNLADNFYPFGAGRRRCPGEPLAKLEVFIFFTTLLQKCHFLKVPGENYTLENKFGLTLKPAKDYKVLVRARSG